jgi:hypothetical protein
LGFQGFGALVVFEKETREKQNGDGREVKEPPKGGGGGLRIDIELPATEQDDKPTSKK